MKLILASKLMALIFILPACQVTTFSNITDGVRTAVTYENSSKKRVVSKTIEMFDALTGQWFEAERGVDGTYAFTSRGQAVKRQLIANEERASGGY
ncbi:MAG: hypothetical protein CMM45_03845 [Rhodospirillaceae bacterium]|nr:hypothetical protein [Rhodospirillaceae bacterium]